MSDEWIWQGRDYNAFGYARMAKIAAVPVLILILFVAFLVIVTVPGKTAADPVVVPAATISQPEVYTETPTQEITPDPDLEFYRLQGHNLGIPWTIIRTDVEGKKDLVIKTVVYDYRMMPFYQYWSVSWAKYLYMVPEPDKKFLFVFVASWMGDGSDPSQSPNFWGFDQDNFAVQYDGNITYRDREYQPDMRIRELEETWDYCFNNTGHPMTCGKERIGNYGYFIKQDKGTGKITAISKDWMKMGESNGWSGYIVYQIPKKADPRDIYVLLAGEGFGHPFWRLAK